MGKGSKLNRGPFGYKQLVAALKLLGAEQGTGTRHPIVMKHPVHGWKVPVSDKWDSLRKGDPIYNGIARTVKMTNDELCVLLNKVE